MKRRGLSYRQALAKHPGCRIELTYLAVDATYAESAPTATAPAIVVWPPGEDASADEKKVPLAVYWLREDE
jgi:hypothetical protein